MKSDLSGFEYLDYLNNIENWYPSIEHFKEAEAQNVQAQEAKASYASGSGPLIFSLKISAAQDEIPIHDLLEVLLTALSLEKILLLFFKDNSSGNTDLYLGLAPDDKYVVPFKELEHSMYQSQEILLTFFNDASLGYSITPVSYSTSIRLQNKINHFKYAACFNGAIGMLDRERDYPKSKILQHLSTHTSYFCIMVLRPLSIQEIKVLEDQTEQLCDNLSTLVTRSRSIVHSKATNCSSGNSLSGSLTNTNSKLRGSDRREIAIDINGDDEADFWTRIAKPPQDNQCNNNNNNFNNTNNDQECCDNTNNSDDSECEHFLNRNPKNTSDSNTTNTSDTNSDTKENHPSVNATNNGQNENAITRSRSLSKVNNCIRSASANDSCSNSKSYTCTTTCSMGETTFNANAKCWMQYIDNEPNKRFNYGLTHKMYLNNLILLSDSECDLQLNGSCIQELMSEHCHFAPYKMTIIPANHCIIKNLCQYHIPYYPFPCCDAELLCHTSLSQYVLDQKRYNGSLITDFELAFLIGYLAR